MRRRRGLIARRPSKPVKRRLAWTADEIARLKSYAPDGTVGPFVRFCRECVRILDKEVRPAREIPFELFDPQTALAAELVGGIWAIILKARQLGITWLVAAYVAWNLIYRDYWQALCIAQPGGYALDFWWRVRFILDRVPSFFRIGFIKDSTSDGIMRLTNLSELRVLEPGTTKGHQKGIGRSFTGDLCLIDEAAYVPGFRDILDGLVPGMTRSEGRGGAGQIVVATTSDGPVGEFADLFKETRATAAKNDEGVYGVAENGFKLSFIAWHGRPGRDQAWYDRQKAILGPNRIKWEHPATIDEAFESGAGRVYPSLSRERHVDDIKIPDYAQLGRAVDWGETRSAFAVLWIAYIEGPPGFLISPKCPNTIDEHFGYKFGPDGRPLKDRDHTCDAVRYFVTTHMCKGMVYIYREQYILDAVEQGLTPAREIVSIHEDSGWVRQRPGLKPRWVPGVKGEKYVLGTVTDPSQGLIRNAFQEGGIPCMPAVTLRAPTSHGTMKSDSPWDAKLEGIAMIRNLIDGTVDLLPSDWLLGPPRQELEIRMPRGKRESAAALRRLIELRRR